MPAATPLTFQRLYAHHGEGPVYPATPERVTTVLRSMSECADSEAPFNVRFCLSDGSAVVCRPKRKRGRA